MPKSRVPMSLTVLALLLFAFALCPAQVRAQQPVPAIRTKPFGFIDMTITPAASGYRRTSMLSAPLLNTDPSIPSTGEVKAVQDAGTVEVQPYGVNNAAIPDAYLSNVSRPFIFHVTSGNLQGAMFLVSSSVKNTNNRITLYDPSDPGMSLMSSGLRAGDRYKILRCDTISSLFGTPQTSGVVGGISPTNADNIVLISNGAASTYYYSTQFGAWTKVGLGGKNSDNVPILPYQGIQYSRVSTNQMSIRLAGEIPTLPRRLKVRTVGSTLLSSFWPVDMSLASSGINQISGWRMAPVASSADRLTLTFSGVASTYIHDSTGWKKVALSMPSGDGVKMPPGSAVLINRMSGGETYSTWVQAPPYSF